MRTLYDSVNPAAIPASAQLVAGYIDSIHYTWAQAAWERFPGAIKIRIATRASTNDGDVLDVEPGDATALQAVSWVIMRRAAGADPSVYCNYSTWGSVQAAFRAAGVAQPHYWVAKYDGVAALPSLNGITAVAKQFNDPPGSGGDWDISCVADHWPGVDKGDPVSATGWDQNDEYTLDQLGVQINTSWKPGTLALKEPGIDSMTLVDMVNWLVHSLIALETEVTQLHTAVTALQPTVTGTFTVTGSGTINGGAA